MNDKQKEKQQQNKLKTVASICHSCKNFNSNDEWSCVGMEAVFTGCVCYNKNAKLMCYELN